jgi:hypothetical protein
MNVASRLALAACLAAASCGTAEGAVAPAPGTAAAVNRESREPAAASARPAGTAEATAPRSQTREARGRAGAPARIGARHVLVQYMGAERAASSVVRTSDQARKVAEEVLARAKAGEDFARLAVEFSDEPGAANRGGSLGRFGKGQMVPAFDAAVFKLEVSEIALVETPFGFHVVQRTD